MNNCIRKAELKDIDDILKLLGEVLELHAEFRPDIFVSGTTKFTYKDIEEKINNGDLIFVYEKDNKVVGHLFADIEEVTSINQVKRKELYIGDLCVLDGYRHLGIATSLYNHIKKYAKDNGISYITLKVWEGNSATKFYEKLGLTPRLYLLEEKL